MLENFLIQISKKDGRKHSEQKRWIRKCSEVELNSKYENLSKVKDPIHGNKLEYTVMHFIITVGSMTNLI